MREMAQLSGIAEGTLRMWEARHGFPAPERLPSGHRRYTERDLEEIRLVLAARAQGLSLGAAIDRARAALRRHQPSVFAALRAGYPHLQTQLLPKRALVCLSHAIEDESTAHADRPLLFGCFQRERFYREAEPRWREMAATASRAVVLADFERRRVARRDPVEVPIHASDAVIREWVIVCEGTEFAACMVGFERPGKPRGTRWFETIWSAERPVVRAAARICAELAVRGAPQLIDDLRFLDDPVIAHPDDVRRLASLTTRMVRYATSSPVRPHGDARSRM